MFVHPSAVLFRYAARNPKGTALILTFDNQKETLSQRVQPNHQTSAILDEDDRSAEN
jgi:hypothetical protein